MDAVLPTEFMKASAAARLAGGRGMAFDIQGYMVLFCAKTHEEEAKIQRPEVGRGHEDDEAGNRDWDRVDEEPESVAHVVAGKAVVVRVHGYEDV